MTDILTAQPSPPTVTFPRRTRAGLASADRQAAAGGRLTARTAVYIEENDERNLCSRVRVPVFYDRAGTLPPFLLWGEGGEGKRAGWGVGGERLVGLVVKVSASKAEGPGFESRLQRDFFSGSSHTSDLKICTPVATLPGTWRYRVGAGTGWPDVSIL